MTVMTEQKIEDLLKRSMQKDERAKDFFIDPQVVKYGLNGKLITPNDNYGFTEWGKAQLCNKVGIPITYIEKCPKELQGQNINYWLKQQKSGASWFVRTLDDGEDKRIRSVLTDKYTTFDNTSVLKMVHDATKDRDVEIKRFWTDDHFDGFHLRLTLPEISINAGETMDGKPDKLTFGLHIANSEVGKRSISITPFIYRLVCTNGLMVVAEKGDRFSQRHIGVKHEDMPLKVAQAFERAVAQGKDQLMKFATTKTIDIENPLKLIEDITRKVKQIHLPKDFAERTKTAFEIERLQPRKATVYDIVNSFTRASQSLDDDQRVVVESFIYRELVA